jgi:putative phage-type endonuclease
MTALTKSQEWHEKRKEGIGGSDAPVIVLGEYFGKTPRDLFLEKTGAIVPPDINNPDIRRGNRQEPIAAQVYAEKTGDLLRVDEHMLRHPKFPFMLAHIDREILPSGDVLEIKCPRSMVYRKYQLEGIPEGIQIQGQHYLSVKGSGRVVFAIFAAELDDMLIVPVERDQELIDLIEAKESVFWDHVQAGEMPWSETEEKIELPPIGGELVRVDTEAWRMAATAWLEVQTMEKEVQALKTQTKQELIKHMDGQPVVEGTGLRVYYKEQGGRRTFDKATFKAAHPEINIDKFYKTGKPFKSFRPYEIKEN